MARVSNFIVNITKVRPASEFEFDMPALGGPQSLFHFNLRPVYGFEFEIPGFNLMKTSIKNSVSDYILKHSQTCTLCTDHPLDSKFLAVIDRVVVQR